MSCRRRSSVVTTVSAIPISYAGRHTDIDIADGMWNARSPDEDVATPTIESTSSSQNSPTATERAESVAESSVTSASSSKRPKNYVCSYEECGKAFDRPIRLQMHIRSHTNERPFPCTEEGCDKSFLRNEHLKAHIKAKHNDDRGYVCTYKMHNVESGVEEECGKGFHTATRLRRHIAMHEEKEQTRCQDCGKEFRKQETLQRHIKSVHLNEKAFRCTHVEAGTMDEECGQSFSNPRQLKAHEARSHSGARYFCHICVPAGVDDSMMDEADDSMSLQNPQVGFQSYADLQTHIKLVHPPTCSTCGKACETNRALMAHMDIEHSSLTDRQRFECTEPGCGRKFTKAGNMKVHIQTVHAKTKKFICGEFDLTKSRKVEGWQGQGCGYSFGTKANLEEHVRTQHLNMPGTTRPNQKNTSQSNSRLQSPALNKIDDTAASLLTGYGYEKDRPIACLEPNCPQRFMRNFDLETHMDMVHQWIIDDIDEAVREREAREGGKFWIGGGEDIEAEEDREFRRLLVEGLQLGGQSVPVAGNGLGNFLQASAHEDMDMSGGAAIDPALSGL
jgi:general transcription factor IIIA